MRRHSLVSTVASRARCWVRPAGFGFVGPLGWLSGLACLGVVLASSPAGLGSCRLRVVRVSCLQTSGLQTFRFCGAVSRGVAVPALPCLRPALPRPAFVLPSPCIGGVALLLPLRRRPSRDDAGSSLCCAGRLCLSGHSLLRALPYFPCRRLSGLGAAVITLCVRVRTAAYGKEGVDLGLLGLGAVTGVAGGSIWRLGSRPVMFTEPPGRRASERDSEEARRGRPGGIPEEMHGESSCKFSGARNGTLVDFTEISRN